MKPLNLGSSVQMLWATAVLATLMTGCASPPPADKTATDGQTVVATTPGGDTGTSTAGTKGTGVSGTAARGDVLHDPRSVLSKRSVYFDFDSYVVKDEYKPLIEAHGKYLQANRNARITIQGNCDEHGSREYNIALGQRRADTVKRMMQLYGATDAQIETVSFGKEKPKNPGHDESAWTENRRDDLVYAGE
jgi:peptidoglycan-associated lipoprotein